MKTKIIYIIAGLILLVVLYQVFKNMFIKEKQNNMPKSEPNNEPQKRFTEQDFAEDIQKIKEQFGEEIAQRVEQIFRLETGNFKSLAYKVTGSAGRLWVERYDKDKPKWCVWIKPKYKDGKLIRNEIVPEGTVGAKKYCYVIYPSVYSAMLGLANHLKKYGIDNGTMRWGHGTDEVAGKKYLAQVKSIIPKYA